MNIQLVAVNEDGNDVWLDLYEEQPIRLTFNIEDIVTATPKSEFSRTFRLPATDNNYNFFSTIFEVNGVDFNPGIKYPARIVIDGADFRVGELRLQNVFKNDLKNRVDYECVFLGTTRALATELGEKRIGELDWSDYVGDLDLNIISASWDAYPVGSLLDGLFGGNLLFPVVDFGNTYSGAAGVTDQTRIAIGHPSSDGGSFDQSNHPLEYTRFKPMVRLKETMRRIFEQNGFTISGQFFNTNTEVLKMYLSAWGNDEAVDVNANNSNLAKWGRDVPYVIDGSGGGNLFALNQVYEDPGGNLNPVINYPSFAYTIPANGNYQWDVFYDLTFSFIDGNSYSQWTVFTGGIYSPLTSYRFTIEPGPGAAISQFTVEKDTGGGYATIYQTTDPDGGVPAEDNDPAIEIYNFSIGDSYSAIGATAGQVINVYQVVTTPLSAESNEMVINGGSYIEITEAVGQFSVAPMWNNDYKCTDLIKDVFTMFRLVMVPDPNNPTNFLITPWNDYIGRGQLKNWSTKLCKDKDIVIKPLLLEQPDRVTFTYDGDNDYYNTENQTIFDEVFSTKKLDSTYEILDGEKEYKTKLAATPASQLDGYTANWDALLFPHIHVKEPDDAGNTIFKPIKPKTRLLYYDGLKSLSGDSWYAEDAALNTVQYTSIPVVSYSDQMPQLGPNNRNLQWERELHFDQSGNALNTFGQDLYGRYWSKYIELLYNKNSRRVTAYFTLDADDILDFRYNDVIYVEGVYYYIEKIYDAPLGQKSKVKVDLITLKDYRPAVNIAPQPTNIVWENASSNWEAGYPNNWENV